MHSILVCCSELLSDAWGNTFTSANTLENCVTYIHKYNTIQYNTIQYNTIQYNTIQYNTIQYNTIQYNTITFNSPPKRKFLWQIFT